MIRKQKFFFIPFVGIIVSACGQDMIIVSKESDCDANVWYLDADEDSHKAKVWVKNELSYHLFLSMGSS